MSYARFAPITASLLARKGAAMPSSMTPPFLPGPQSVARPPLPELLAVPPVPDSDHDGHPPNDPSRPKKLFIAMTHREHERLAIAAVKTGLSRHQLMRDALEMYFEQLSADMGEDCACITGGFSSRSGCCMS